MAIDYGEKRTGLAVTDPLKFFPKGLATVETDQLSAYLTTYLREEEVECIVVGLPLNEDDSPTKLTAVIQSFVADLREQYPDLEVITQDERYTSHEARKWIRQSGAKRKKRQDKALLDQVSAMVILKEYMESKGL